MTSTWALRFESLRQVRGAHGGPEEAPHIPHPSFITPRSPMSGGSQAWRMLARSCSYSKLLEEIWEAVGQDLHTYLVAPSLRVLSEAWLGSIASGHTDAQDLCLGQGPGGLPVFLDSELCRGSDA